MWPQEPDQVPGSRVVALTTSTVLVSIVLVALSTALLARWRATFGVLRPAEIVASPDTHPPTDLYRTPIPSRVDPAGMSEWQWVDGDQQVAVPIEIAMDWVVEGEP